MSNNVKLDKCGCTVNVPQDYCEKEGSAEWKLYCVCPCGKTSIYLNKDGAVATKVNESIISTDRKVLKD